jgi:SAM-dependent methyltransferase
MTLADGFPALLASDPGDPETLKACCAAAYGHDLVGTLLGDSYHPGGADLTRRLADTMQLRVGERLLDVASGTGTSPVLLADEYGVHVTGVDLGPAQVTTARARADELGLDDQVRFEVGDTERLAFGAERFDAVICECALCTFPSKPAVLGEMARVLRPGARVGITDVWLEPDRLDAELRGLAGRIACLADARPIAEQRALIEGAVLEVTHVEQHDDALAATIEQVRSRLRALRLADLPALRTLDLRRGIELAGRAADAVERGDAGYLLVVATKPQEAETM